MIGGLHFELSNLNMQNIIQNVQERFLSCYYRDRTISNRIVNKISEFYYDRRSSNDKTIRFRSTEEGVSRIMEGRVNSRFNYSGSFSLPFIDNDLRSIIQSNNPKSNPNYIKETSRSEVKRSDNESIRKYTSICKSIGRGYSTVFVNASIAAGQHLGYFGKDISKRSRLKFKILSPDEAIESAIKNSNAGYPTFQNKRNKVAINDVKVWLNTLIKHTTIYSMYKNVLLYNPMSLMHRFQPSVNLEDKSVETKIRQVWCVPFRIIALENMFFKNILDNYVNYNLNSNNPSSSNGMTNSQISDKLVRKMRSLLDTKPDCKLYSIDYSKYDRTIPDFAIDLFFCTTYEFLDLDDNMTKLYDMLRYYTKYGPIVTDRRLYFKARGISSGSLITNFFDSWWNLVLWYVSRIMLRKGKSFDELPEISLFSLNDFEYRNDVVVCGDDAIIYLTEKELLLHKELCLNLGMSVSHKMSTNSDNDLIYFLGRFWTSRCEPIQSEVYLTTHIIFRTRWYKKTELNIDISKELDPSRILSICLPFVNGKDYIIKTFKDYKPLIDLIKKGRFAYLKDYPSVNVIKNVQDCLNWRAF